MPLQRFVQGVEPVDQQSVIVVLFQPRFDPRVEVSEQGADLTTAFHFKDATQAIAMTMQVAAFVLQSFIAVGSVEFVLFFDQHLNAPEKTRS
jgi:hypothetical protein